MESFFTAHDQASGLSLSISQIATLKPCSFKDPAIFKDVVVLPEPPFCWRSAIVFAGFMFVFSSPFCISLVCYYNKEYKIFLSIHL